jgi:putative ABC transport system permease protein
MTPHRPPPRPRGAVPPSTGERVYRALLRLYPSSFRRRYGDDMMAFYRDRARHAPRTVRARARLWLALAGDVAVNAAAERLAFLVERTRPVPAAGPVSTPREESMSVLIQDVRFALRGMLGRPVFSATILATLALGIGANAAIFIVVNAALLRPLPYSHVEQIVAFVHADPYSQVSEGEFVDYRRGLSAFAGLAAYSTPEATVGAGDESIRAGGARVSSDFFSVLGVVPELGRTFAPDEFLPRSASQVTVISHALWQQQFAGDPRVVGRTVTINGTPVTIIGVMPAGFDFPKVTTGFWTPWRFNPDSLWGRNNHYLRMVGRLAPTATIGAARAQAGTLDARWLKDFPETYGVGKPIVAAITPLGDYVLGASRPYLGALLGAVGFILLIACVNVASLLLVRGEARRKELAIRTALGASRHRVVRQMLTESLLFAIIGSALGIGLAWFGARALVALAPDGLPRLHDVGVDYRVVAFTTAITILTGLLFGLGPAVFGARNDSITALREGGRTSSRGASGVARRVLVVVEVALAVVLLTGAGLLVRSMVKLQAIDLGFSPARVMTMRLTVPPVGYNDTTTDLLFRDVLASVGRVPGVQSVALDGALPISGDDSDWSIMIDGRVIKNIGDSPSAKPEQVTPGYFSTMGIRLVRGRDFAESDRPGAPPVVVINQALANKLWPGVNPIGRTLKMFSDQAPWLTIVGVVGDIRARGFQGAIPETMYFPYAQSAASAYYMPRSMSLVARTALAPADVANAIRAAVHSVQPRMPISEIASMDDVVGQSIAARRFTTVLLVGFAGLALLLAGVGIYGVISYGVSQRTYEIGVRMALGASPGSVLALVMNEGIRMTAVGLVLGLAGAAVVTGFLRSLLVGVGAADAPTFIGVGVVLAAVAVCACAFPARRAIAVSPTEALRND